MKTFIWQAIAVLGFSAGITAAVEAGVIPYSLIQDEKNHSNTVDCESLGKRQSELLKKISELQRQEKSYLSELEKMSGASCGSARGQED